MLRRQHDLSHRFRFVARIGGYRDQVGYRVVAGMSDTTSLFSDAHSLHPAPQTVEIETPATDACPLGKCDGSGEIKYTAREPEDTKKDIGNGYYIGASTTMGTTLCPCRQDLPERDGSARWWSSKSVYSAEWQAVVFEPTAEISVSGEVPISEDNYVLKRTLENAYWPCSVSVEFSDPSMGWLFPDEARELARLLVEAADAADAYDDLPEMAE